MVNETAAQFKAREEAAYAAWKQRYWRQPLNTSVSGCALLLVSILLTLGGAVLASIIVHGLPASSGLSGKVLVYILTPPVVFVGFIAYVLGRRTAWRMTREYRALRRQIRAEQGGFGLLPERDSGLVPPDRTFGQ